MALGQGVRQVREESSRLLSILMAVKIRAASGVYLTAEEHTSISLKIHALGDLVVGEYLPDAAGNCTAEQMSFSRARPSTRSRRSKTVRDGHYRVWLGETDHRCGRVHVASAIFTTHH